MAESYIEVTEGSGKKLHSFQRSIGGNNVQDEVFVLGEPYLATYSISFAASTATSASHLVELMAGSTNLLRIREIYVSQSTASTVAATALMGVHRLTSAGTGGTSISVVKLDPSDSAAGASAMSLPTSKGTLSSDLLVFSLPMAAAAPLTDVAFHWRCGPNQKPIIVSAGTSNGIALRIGTGVASGQLRGYIIFDESSF